MIIGLALIFLSLLIKLGLPPFHGWLVEIYDSIPYFLVLFYSIFVKLAFLFLLIRFILMLEIAVETFFIFMFLFVIILSFIIGCIGGLGHTRLRRILAFSSIFNAGTMLLPIVYGQQLQTSIVFMIMYAMYYMFSMLGVVLVLMYAQS